MAVAVDAPGRLGALASADWSEAPCPDLGLRAM